MYRSATESASLVCVTTQTWHVHSSSLHHLRCPHHSLHMVAAVWVGPKSLTNYWHRYIRRDIALSVMHQKSKVLMALGSAQQGHHIIPASLLLPNHEHTCRQCRPWCAQLAHLYRSYHTALWFGPLAVRTRRSAPGSPGAPACTLLPGRSSLAVQCLHTCANNILIGIVNRCTASGAASSLSICPNGFPIERGVVLSVEQ